VDVVGVVGVVVDAVAVVVAVVVGVVVGAVVGAVVGDDVRAVGGGVVELCTLDFLRGMSLLISSPSSSCLISDGILDSSTCAWVRKLS